VKAIIMRRAISREGTKQKANDENLHCAFTPFSVDLQGFNDLGCQF
jgi:hypothetical protein